MKNKTVVLLVILAIVVILVVAAYLDFSEQLWTDGVDTEPNVMQITQRDSTEPEPDRRTRAQRFTDTATTLMWITGGIAVGCAIIGICNIDGD